MANRSQHRTVTASRTAPPAPPADTEEPTVTDTETVTEDTAATETGDTAATETGNGQIDPATVASVGVDVTRCDGKNEAGTRQCILAPHDESVPHKFRAAGTKKTYAPVDLTALSFEDVPEEEEVTGIRETARDAAQLEIDNRVKKSHEDWIAAGKPEEFNKSPRKRIMFPAGQEDAILHMLDRAGRFLNLRVRTAGPKTHESGARMVYYVGMDKLARKSKPKTEPAPEPATETAPETAAESTETAAPDTADIEPATV